MVLEYWLIEFELIQRGIILGGPGLMGWGLKEGEESERGVLVGLEESKQSYCELSVGPRGK